MEGRVRARLGVLRGSGAAPVAAGQRRLCRRCQPFEVAALAEVRGLARAVSTATSANAKKAASGLVAPAIAPAAGEPANCPTAIRRNAAPSPAEGLSRNTSADHTRRAPVTAM